jgi:hypothetical protein
MRNGTAQRCPKLWLLQKLLSKESLLDSVLVSTSLIPRSFSSLNSLWWYALHTSDKALNIACNFIHQLHSVAGRKVFTLLYCQMSLVYIYKCPTRCNNAQCIFFISLQIYSTCFGCHLHPSSGVQETVVVDHWYKSYCKVQGLQIVKTKSFRGWRLVVNKLFN